MKYASGTTREWYHEVMTFWSPRPKEKSLPFLREYGTALTISILLVVSFFSLAIIVKGATPSPLTVSFFDVGQGDAILIQTPSGHDVLIDGGPSDSVLVRLDEKMNYFDRHIDMIIATHDDSDHITGLVPVLKKYSVDHIVRSPVYSDTELAHVFASSSENENAVMHIGEKGDVIDLGDGAAMRILYPTTTISPKSDTNDASVSVLLTYGEHSFLLTGDLSTRYESRLLNEQLPHHITVFKAGHHGSKTSSGETLLSYIRPEYAVISAGKDNRYGHPHADTLGRLKVYAQETVSTAASGTLVFETDGRLLTIRAENNAKDSQK